MQKPTPQAQAFITSLVFDVTRPLIKDSLRRFMKSKKRRKSLSMSTTPGKESFTERHP